MLTAIPAHRITPPKTGHICLRCGISYDPHHLKGERGRFCTDCRPEAANLGWCEPTKRHAKTLTAAA